MRTKYLFSCVHQPSDTLEVELDAFDDHATACQITAVSLKMDDHTVLLNSEGLSDLIDTLSKLKGELDG